MSRGSDPNGGNWRYSRTWGGTVHDSYVSVTIVRDPRYPSRVTFLPSIEGRLGLVVVGISGLDDPALQLQSNVFEGGMHHDHACSFIRSRLCPNRPSGGPEIIRLRRLTNCKTRSEGTDFLLVALWSTRRQRGMLSPHPSMITLTDCSTYVTCFSRLHTAGARCRPVDLDRYPIREGSRIDQVKRNVRARIGE